MNEEIMFFFGEHNSSNFHIAFLIWLGLFCDFWGGSNIVINIGTFL